MSSICCQVAEQTPYLRVSHGASDTNIAVLVSYMSFESRLTNRIVSEHNESDYGLSLLSFCNCYQINDVRYNSMLSFIYSFTHHSSEHVSKWGSF